MVYRRSCIQFTTVTTFCAFRYYFNRIGASLKSPYDPMAHCELFLPTGSSLMLMRSLIRLIVELLFPDSDVAF